MLCFGRAGAVERIFHLPKKTKKERKNMKTIIKVVALLLVLMMIVPCLAACNDDKDKKNDVTDNTGDNGDNGDDTGNGGTGGEGTGNGTGNGTGGSTVGPEGPGVEDEGDPYLKDIDMERHEYNALVRGQESGNGAFYCEDFWVDPTTGGGDALSFAVIERNERIETTYNCQIIQNWSTMASMYEEISQAFSSNRKYDLTIIVATDAASCATSGYLSNIKNDFNTQYINLANEAFDQNSIEEMSLGDALYYLSGDMNISTMDNTIATVFNTNMYWDIADAMVETFEDDDFASPYTMVEEGKWTVQNMLKIAKENTNDVNDADGPLAYDKGDTIGYYQYQASGLYYYYGAGMRITENAGGYPSFTINSDEAGEVYDTLFNLMNLGLNSWQPNGASNDRAKNFTSGAVLFADYLLWDVRRALYPAQINFAYGILPIPTLEENEEYLSVVYFQNCTHMWALPYKRANNEYAAQMFYILAVESAAEDSTMDAYYIRTMYMEVAKDDGSRASLDIIRGALVYDIALLYTPQGDGLWGSFDDLLLRIDTATDKEYATYTSSERMQQAEEDMQLTIDTFNKYGAE